MIFVTADTHGDMKRFEEKEIKKLKKTDTLIVLGDFGFVWENDDRERKNLKKLAKLPFKIIFMDGLNENFDALKQYPETVYCSAVCREIEKDKIYYIRRGEVPEIEDKKLLCFGGCDSYDPDIVVSENDPTQADFDNCTENLAKHNNSVDFILTHMPSGRINRFINLDSNFSSECMDFFDVLSHNIQYTKWYFGCMHIDKYISPKVQAVYTNVVPLWEEKKKGFFRR